MRIIHLTPGTGNFHCGSCLRDNLLVKELRRRGHDVVMVPLYLPLVTDGDPASPDVPVFLGGINLFLQDRSPLFRKLPRWLWAWLDSPRLLRLAADRASMTTAKQLGEMTLGSFAAASGRQAKEWERLVDWIAEQDPQPDLVSLSNGLLIGIAKSVREKVGIPVVSSLQGEDAFLDSLPDSYREKAWQQFREESQHVARFVAVSDFYGDVMREKLKGSPVPIDRVYNGIDLSPFGHVEREEGVPLTIGYLARMCHGKGMHTLVDAFLLLQDRGWGEKIRLEIAGSKTDVDDAFIADQKAKIAKAGIPEERVRIRPNLDADEKIRFLNGLDILSVPATYGEAFGLYIVEALACHVPVAQPKHGAFPEVLERSGGGLLCDPDDPESLADSLEKLLEDASLRERLGGEGRAGVEKHFSVASMAEAFEAVCENVLDDAKESSK